jgi:hypothetical protein
VRQREEREKEVMKVKEYLQSNTKDEDIYRDIP